MELIRQFLRTLDQSFRNLLPIVLVVGLFQFVLLRQVPDGMWPMVAGLGVVVFGIALFLQGLHMGVFPLGNSISDDFATKGSVPLLMVFGFCLGFSAVIAEPALIAVAEQAAIVSEGKVNKLLLRVLVATSVGLVVTLGILRILFGHPLHWYMIFGYITVVAVTFIAPPEIVGLAYDSGGVTTNIVTVPLIAALGLGLAGVIRGRNLLTDGFGLVALAVMVPMITVQLYGAVVFSGAGTAAPDLAAIPAQASPAPQAPDTARGLLGDLLTMLRDVAPMILVIVVFQALILRKAIPRLPRVLFGFILVVLGLYAFVVGLKLGLFPVGKSMAEQLIERDSILFIYLFAFLIGFATTLAEPALIAIGDKAAEAARGRINGNVIRIIVALGVAVGITIGVHRIITGDSIHLYVMAGYALVIALTAITPRYIVALAYDLGGVTTSEVTVPLITALGIGLAMNIEGRSPLIDGFGLIAFASIFPIVAVMIYAIVIELIARLRGMQT